MKLTWLGTASLLFEEAGRTAAFDPFPGIPPEKPAVRLARRADEVFVTHGHFDHICRLPALYAGRRGPSGEPVIVHCTRTPYETLRGRGFPAEQLELAAPGREIRTGPFTLRAYPSRHCRFDRKLIAETALAPRFLTRLPRAARLGLLAREFPEAGETLFWELSCGGTRVQVMGSLNLLADADYPAGADLLILPYQGRSVTGRNGGLAEYAADLVRRLRPKTVLLDHYDDSFPPLSAQIPTEGIERICEERLGTACRPLKRYETIEI